MIKMSEQMKINHFHSLLMKNALQTFRNISTSSRQTLEDVLVIFRRKYVKPESQATVKHKWQRLVYYPNTMKLSDLIQERRLKSFSSPRLQYDQLVSVRQYIRSDPPTKTFYNYKQQLMGYPSVV